jgi:hypothetical protein
MGGDKMESPSIDPIKRNTIDIYGLIGKFELQEKPIRVRYFSAKASSWERSSGEFALLKELKPMRERVAPKELKDLSSLLQRDLSDARVAMELIPYLKGSSDIAFFPAILAILIPTGFITSQSSSYPSPQKGIEDNREITQYADNWTLTAYPAGSSYGPLGMLSIDPSRTDIVVLDGQHRANAFRFMSGVFGNDDTDIHSAFYQGLEGSNSFNAELPVTLVWFESDNSLIEPTLISRRLFVDVNNSARKVSKSRNILLNDKELPSLMIRFFYSGIAQKASFQANVFSLLHSAFDIDTDVAKRSGNIFTLTNPEIVEYVASWLLFDYGNYSELGIYRVQREGARSGMVQFTREFCEPIFNGSHVEIDQDDKVVIKTTDKISDFVIEFNRKIFPVLYNIFNEFNLFRQRYVACQKISEWRNTSASPTERDVWDSVFCGGEGLYYTLLYSKEEGPVTNQRLSDLRSAVESIETRLVRERASLFSGCSQPDVEQAFDSVRSKAFQVGLFMALEKFRSDNTIDDLLSACDEFLRRLNQLCPIDWIYILTRIKPALISGVDPKSWPAYQKLVLRVIQAEGEFYNAGNFLISPDGKIFSEAVNERFNSWLTTEEKDLAEITKDDIPDLVTSWAQSAKEYVSNLFNQANLTPIEIGVDYERLARSIVEGRIPSRN